MNVVAGLPPNINQIAKRFNLTNITGVVFTYGDTIYNPSNGIIDVYLMTHEETHSRQQGESPWIWWKKYLVSDSFRLSQEVEAYRAQYEHFCKNKKDPFKEEQFLTRLASDLSSPMYGSICSLEEAKEYICQK